MALRREFKGKIDYQERAICDDFLEQLVQSTNSATKIKELVPKSPCLWIGDGLYDKGCWLTDPQLGMTGLGLFRVGFGQQNTPSPINNIWELDVGKLVAPRVFMDIDLLTQIAKSYDPIARNVRNVNGGPLIETTDDEL